MDEESESDAGAVFISYARRDQSFVLKLATDLLTSGVTLWLDQLDIAPRDKWDHAIQRALKRCSAVLVVLSPASVASDTVLDEVAVATNERKPVISVRYQACDLPLKLTRENYIDLVSDYKNGLSECIDALSRAGVQVLPLDQEDATRESKLLRISLAKAEEQIKQYEMELEATNSRPTSESGSNHDLEAALSKLAEIGGAGVERALELLASGRREDAVASLDQAAEEKAASEPHLAATLFRRAGAIAFTHDTRRALAAYEKALELDPSDFMTQKSLGDLFIRTGEYARAKEAYEVALKLGRGRADQYHESGCHAGLGNAYLFLGQYAEGEEHILTALEIAKRAQHPVATVVALNNLANLEQARGEYTNAQAHVTEAIAAAKSAGLEFMTAECLGTLGELHATQGNLESAKQAFQKSMAIAERFGRTEATVSQHLALASIADRVGDAKLSKQHLECALQMSEAMKFSRGVCMAKTGLALLLSKAGLPMEAKEMLQDALTTSRASGDHNLSLGALFQLGQVNSSLQDYDEAHDCFRESFELLDAMGQRKGKAYMLRMMGLNECQRGNLDKAEARYKESIESARMEGADADVVYGLTALGAASMARGKLDAAEKIFQEALSFAKDKNVPDGDVRMYITQARKMRSSLSSGTL